MANFCALSLAMVVFSASLGFAAQQQVTDPVIASKLGITVQQVHSLQAEFHLTDDQLLALTRTQLQALLEDTKHPGVAKHADGEDFRALRMMDEHGQIPPEGLLRALEHRRDSLEEEADLFPEPPDPSPFAATFGNAHPMFAGIQTNSWTWLGPGNIGGRVRAIVIHPSDQNILWCGGVDGGIWKSTNNGAAWFPLDDFMANLAICSMIIDPTNPNTLYVGTGEVTHNGDGIRGAGIFKTTNGGSSWFRLPSTTASAFQYVGRLAIDPNNNQILLAATRSGVFRSSDGGTNWVQESSSETFDVQFHPTDSSLAIASGTAGLAQYSTNGGVTWFSATGIASGSGRVEVTYARSAPECVYASVEHSGGEIYRSVDGGQTFTQINTGQSFLGAQGWYDNVIWVDPTTTNIVIVGGIDLWRSTDGGAHLSQMSQWQFAPSSAHADHHVIVNYPSYDGVSSVSVLFGNDGGIYRANNVLTVSGTSGWQSLNNNLGITQFYGAGGNAATGVIVGGTQDNGTLRSSPNPQSWSAMYGGDGGFSASDQSNPSYFYGEYVYLQIHRSSDGGSSSSSIYPGITNANSSGANFIAPFILDPNNQNTMLAGGKCLWRSTTVRSTPNWTVIKAPIGTSSSANISAIAVAAGNSDLIWVGHNNGDVYFTVNGTSASPTWTQADNNTPALPNRFCERIAISPVDSNKVFVTFGGFNSDNVWRTSDGGLTWTNISTGLPPAPVNSIVIAPRDPSTIYVGTEVGIYGSPNEGRTWSTGNDGPANVSVEELFWMSNKLVAVTHGRGLYSTTPVLGDAAPIALSSQLLGGNGNGAVDPNECNQLNLVVQNVGAIPITNVTGWVTLSAPEVTVMQGVSSFPDIAPSGSATNVVAFQLSSSPAFACGTPVTVTLSLAYNGTTNVLNYSLAAASGGGYTVSTGSGSITPGVTDIGNHDDDLTTIITLPFGFNFYGQTFSNATLSSNGNLQFQSNDNAYQNLCLPYAGFTYAIMPLWDDLRTDLSGGGIFTSVSGSAPNRVFNIEWRANYFSGAAFANFEIELYEGQSRFDIVYGTLNGNGSSATVGIQKDTTSFLGYECNSGGLSPGTVLTFQQSCVDGGGACSTTEPPTIIFPVEIDGALQFSFASQAGKQYFIQATPDLVNSNWQNQGAPIGGDGSVKTVTNSISGGQKYYRLMVH